MSKSEGGHKSPTRAIALLADTHSTAELSVNEEILTYHREDHELELV
jgi:hypothetical protein